MTMIGLRDSPVRDSEPMSLARAILDEEFVTEKNHIGLRFFRESFWGWVGRRWVRIEERELFRSCFRWLQDTWINGPNGTPVRLGPTPREITNVVEALEAATEVRHRNVPIWTAHSDRPPPARCVGFDDVVVSVHGGTIETFERDETWFDVTTLPVNYNPDAKCPRWERAVREWSDGSPEWQRLLQRWMGYCLMPERNYAKWLLMHGVSRAGKGTILWVLHQMMGTPAFAEKSLDDLASRFGLLGLEFARVLSISEVSDLERRDGERCARVIKNVVGQDPITIDLKHRDMMMDVDCAAAPIICSNEIPRLPNRGRGLSTKMLVLPFTVSFEVPSRAELAKMTTAEKADLHPPQFNLRQELLGELEGIAAWAIEGLRQLVSEEDKPMSMWPECSRAHETVFQYHIANNPLDSFLEARFMRRKGGFVPSALIQKEWDGYLKKNNIRMHIPRNLLLLKMETESSWHLRRGRRRGEEAYVRGMFGLVMRTAAEDEV